MYGKNLRVNVDVIPNGELEQFLHIYHTLGLIFYYPAKHKYMKVTDIAKVAHEINRAFCLAMGDDSQTTWEQAPDWQKESAIKGVEMHLANPSATPEDSHKSWLAQKEADGWVYGEVKDAEKKEHPCMLPYEQLPTDQKAKDYLFRQVVHSLAPYIINDPVPIEEPVVTEGMKAVDAHKEDKPEIVDLKMNFAQAWDAIDSAVALKLRSEYNTQSPTEKQKVAINNINRLGATAKTQLELSSLLAVKAITR